jgi:hypothetical protein
MEGLDEETTCTVINGKMFFESTKPHVIWGINGKDKFRFEIQMIYNLL